MSGAALTSSFLTSLFSPSEALGEPLTSCSNHSRGGHVCVTRHKGIVTGDEGVAWRPRGRRRGRTVRWRHGSSGSWGRERGFPWRVRGLGGCCSSCKRTQSLFAVVINTSFWLFVNVNQGRATKQEVRTFCSWTCSLLVWMIRQFYRNCFCRRNVSSENRSKVVRVAGTLFLEIQTDWDLL